MSHTPGPWHYEAKEGEVHSLFGSICTVHGWDNPDDETVPNAELLASAPRLQEQVQILREALSDNLQAWEGEEESVREEHAELIDETRAALEATKGEG